MSTNTTTDNFIRLSQTKWNKIIKKADKRKCSKTKTTTDIYVKSHEKKHISLKKCFCPKKCYNVCELKQIDVLDINKANNKNYDTTKLLLDNLIYVFENIRTELQEFQSKLSELDTFINNTTLTTESITNIKNQYYSIVETLYNNMYGFVNMQSIDVCGVKIRIIFEVTLIDTIREIIFTYSTCRGTVINNTVSTVDNLGNFMDDTDYHLAIGSLVISIPLNLTDPDVSNFTNFVDNININLIQIINNINKNITILQDGTTLITNIYNTFDSNKKCC